MMLTKRCSKCAEEKPLTDFYFEKKPQRHRADCKPCQIKTVRVYQRANPEKVAVFQRAHVARSRAKAVQRAARWRESNRDRYTEWRRAHAQQINESNRRYYRRNTELYNLLNGKRRALAKQATPSWAHVVAMREMYAFAQIKTRLTGVEWQVDHIVPLRSKLVCGLHTHANLRVVPKHHNLSKGNRYWPDMPLADGGI